MIHEIIRVKPTSSQKKHFDIFSSYMSSHLRVAKKSFVLIFPEWFILINSLGIDTKVKLIEMCSLTSFVACVWHNFARINLTVFY